MKAWSVCVFMLGQLAVYGFDVTITDVADVLSFGREAASDILESWELIKPKDSSDERDFPFAKRMEKVLRRRIDALSNKIDVYEETMELHVDAIVPQLLRQLPIRNRLEDSLREFDHYVGQINDLYEDFTAYSKALDYFENSTMQDFAKNCVSRSLGALPDTLKSLHRLIMPAQSQLYERSILVLLANEMQEASTQICNEHQSPQQLLYNLYTTVAVTEIKGYTIMQFSYMLLWLYNKGSKFTEEVQLLKQQHSSRTAETLRAVKTAMAFAPRDLWRCDPANHKRDETYTELKQLFQGYIVNEVDLNSDSSCRENCAYYEYAKVYGCYQNQFCSQQRRCNGKLVNCEYVDSDMWICPSDKNSTRRYDYIEYENGRMYGEKKACYKGTTKVDSWWRWLFWHCSYCFCYCDEQNSRSERYFSLREVVADMENNKVITGIKLEKKNQIIHMKIQQGELLPKGNINASTIAWKDTDNFSVLDSGLKSGVDYHTMVWEKRALDLDDLVAPENHLLTGIRFRVVGTRLNLEIRITPYNFTEGKLIQLEKSIWHSNDNTDRSELELVNPDIPTRLQAQTFPDSKINEYLNFAPSDRLKDAAQSTIPFLDIQPIVPKPPIPIAGAGIFHKGRKGSGGFVALKLITYNFAPHLQADLPPPPPIIQSANEVSAV